MPLLLISMAESTRRIMINSLGQCGSGMLFKAVRRDHPKAGKCHAFPSDFKDTNIRMVFLYTDPVGIVKSLVNIAKNNIDGCVGLRGMKFIKAHGTNMGYKLPHNMHKNADVFTNKIIHEDIFQLEKYFDENMREQVYPLVAVKYEELWDYQTELNEFLGFDLKLPEKRDKRSKDFVFSEEQMKVLEETYGSLIDKMKAFESFTEFICH